MKINCQQCEEELVRGMDHHCKKPRGKSYTIGFRVINSMYDYAKKGICPHCRGTGENRISHLKNNPLGRGVIHSHVEKYICPTCKGSGKWLRQGLRMTKWERLRKRLREECEIEVGEKFQRCYPGRHQRSAGAWSWVTQNKWNGNWNVGSQWSMTELLKADKITVDFSRVTNDYWIEPGWLHKE